MGSNIVSGSAKAIILTTGGDTYFGSMAKSLNSYEDKSAFEKNLDSVSKLLIRYNRLKETDKKKKDYIAYEQFKENKVKDSIKARVPMEGMEEFLKNRN